MNSLISIIIPTYNRAHLIGETLDSVLAQSYEYWECIIVDDGSTDNTEAVIRNYVKNDARFLFYKRPLEKLKGASSCRNYGLAKSKGKYIQFLDSDDLISSEKFKFQINILEKSDELSFSFCEWGRFKVYEKDAQIFNNLAIYKSFSNPIKLLNSLINSRGYLPIHSFLYSKKLIQAAGLWDENLGLNDDGEFMSRVFVIFTNALFAENCFVLYRISDNGQNLSASSNEDKIISGIKSWETIFKLYKAKFKGKEKKYVRYIKLSIYYNIKNQNPQLLNNAFFKGLSLYIAKNRFVNYLIKVNQRFESN